MSIFADSYQTRVGSIYATDPIVNAIKKAMVADSIQYNNTLMVRSTEDTRCFFIIGNRDSEAEIPLFTHPITFKGREGEQYLCSDIRVFVKKGTPTDNIEKSIRNLTEYKFAKGRAILNLAWITGGHGKIKNTLSFASKVFSHWLSEIIAKNYALDFKDQTLINILSSFYYQTLFTENVTFSDEDRQRMAIHTIKATGASSAQVFEVFDKIEQIKDIEDYCALVPKVTENVRLKDFNLGVLLSIVKNSWYGTNAKEIISVCLEHPPTWVALVYTALSEKTFSNSTESRVAERHGKRGAADEFKKAFLAMMRESLEVDEGQVVPAF